MNSLPNTPYGSVIRQHGPRRRASVTTATPRERKVSFALSPTRALKRVRSKASALNSSASSSAAPGLDRTGESDMSEDEDSAGVHTPLLPESSAFAGPSPFPDLTALSLSPDAKAFTPSANSSFTIERAKMPGQTQSGADVFLLLQQMHARVLAGELMMRSDQDGNGVCFRLPPPAAIPTAPAAFPSSAATGPRALSYSTGAEIESGVPSSSSYRRGFPPGLGLGFDALASLSGPPSYQSSPAPGSYNLAQSYPTSATLTQPGSRLPSYASEAPAGHGSLGLDPPLVLNPIAPLPTFATQLQSGVHAQSEERYQPPHQRTHAALGSGQTKGAHGHGAYPGPKKFERGPAVKARPNTLKWAGPKTDVMCALGEGQVLSRRGKVKLFDPLKGFGFISDGEISALAGRDIFVHYTAIRIKVGFRALWVGEEIGYNLVQVASGGYQALNVRGADGKPLRGLDAFDPSQIADTDCSMDSPEASPQRHSSANYANNYQARNSSFNPRRHVSHGDRPNHPRRDTCQKTW